MGPMQAKRRRRANTQDMSLARMANGMVRLPEFDAGSWYLAAIAFRHFRNEIEDLAIINGSEQPQVLRMRPEKRTCRASRAAASHVHVRPVVFIPDLLGEQTGSVRKPFHRVEIGARIAAGRKFVVTAFAREQRPRSAAAPLHKRTAVGPLAVSIMVVTMPARAVRRVHFEDFIDNSKAIDNQRIICRENSVTNELEETCIDNIARGIGRCRSRRLVGDSQHRHCRPRQA